MNTRFFVTEYGLQKSPWNLVPFIDYVFYQEGPGLRHWQWTEEGMKVINITNILGEGIVDTTNTNRHISENEFLSKYKHFEVDEGDIVIASSGWSYGKVGRIKEWNLPLMMNTSVIRFRSKNKGELNDDFLFHFIKSEFMKNQIDSLITIADKPNFGPIHIKRMSIPLPEYKIQLKIASILSAYDDLIENNLKRIKLLEEKAFLMYKRIVREEKLKKVKLKDVAVVNQSTIKANSDIEKLLYVDIASVSTGSIDNKTEYELKEAPGRAKRILMHQDIIWSCVRPNRKSYSFVWRPEDNLIASTGFAVITAKSIPSTFLYQCITAIEFVSYLENHAKGATYPAVTATDFEDATLQICSDSLMNEYHEEAYQWFELKHILQKQNSKLREARDILLPRLMNGEIEV